MNVHKRRLKVLRREVLAGLLACLHVGTRAQETAVGEIDRFELRPEGPFEGKSLPVYHYQARTARLDARVLFVIHGEERDARATCSNWIDAAEEYGLVLVAPEFGKADFPEALFQMGGLAAPDENQWTFSLIESLFDHLRTRSHFSATGYYLFGHSAGAQFAHRLTLMARQPRLLAVAAANAGTYTMPFYGGLADPPFPYTLSRRLMPEERLAAAFQRPLTVILGEADTVTSGSAVPNSRIAQAQGEHRLARGQRFYALAQEQCHRLGVPLAWKLVTVPGVGHSSKATGRVAASLLFKN